MDVLLDSFQEEAIRAVQAGHSVFVSAPTGAGKTLIAEAAIEKALSHGESTIYTAPIKALSNQKFRDFKALFGEEKVGILTGDVAINPEAPILIMTTEIYRNSLFDHSDRIERTGCVVFDEIHYLDDPERGTVWEEALLFTPLKTRILALSATVPNVDEIADWIRSIHPERPLEVIQEGKRPVPLHFFFQCQGMIMDSAKQLYRDGYLSRDSWRPTAKEKRRGIRMMHARPNRLDHLLDHLIKERRLPAIYFAFGRRRTEYLAWEAAKYDFLGESERQKILAFFDELLIKYDLVNEKSAQDMRPLIEQGIAYHHAGMLPTLKEVIEHLFTGKMISLIFTTETFALGINMPARSVIFDELTKFYGSGFKNLTTRDFYQMAGRAGRRGIDTEGFVYMRTIPSDITFSEVERMIFGEPEAISSQFNTTYATLLNLYRDLGKSLTEIYPKSFYYFQYHGKKREKGMNLIRRKLMLLESLGYLTPEGLTPKGEFASALFGYELIMAEMYESGLLENVNEADLCVLVSCLSFEPRKGLFSPVLRGKYENFRKAVDHHFNRIYQEESKHQIHSRRLIPHFHVCRAVEAWARGEDFHRLFREVDIDEGELVRHLRMIIQLLRELAWSKHVPEKLRVRAQHAMHLINRDVVDAEKQLRGD